MHTEIVDENTGKNNGLLTDNEQCSSSESELEANIVKPEEKQGEPGRKRPRKKGFLKQRKQVLKVIKKHKNEGQFLVWKTVSVFNELFCPFECCVKETVGKEIQKRAVVIGLSLKEKAEAPEPFEECKLEVKVVIQVGNEVDTLTHKTLKQMLDYLPEEGSGAGMANKLVFQTDSGNWEGKFEKLFKGIRKNGGNYRKWIKEHFYNFFKSKRNSLPKPLTEPELLALGINLQTFKVARERLITVSAKLLRRQRLQLLKKRKAAALTGSTKSKKRKDEKENSGAKLTEALDNLTKMLEKTPSTKLLLTRQGYEQLFQTALQDLKPPTHSLPATGHGSSPSSLSSFLSGGAGNPGNTLGLGGGAVAQSLLQEALLQSDRLVPGENMGMRVQLPQVIRRTEDFSHTLPPHGLHSNTSLTNFNSYHSFNSPTSLPNFGSGGNLHFNSNNSFGGTGVHNLYGGGGTGGGGGGYGGPTSSYSTSTSFSNSNTYPSNAYGNPYALQYNNNPSAHATNTVTSTSNSGGGSPPLRNFGRAEEMTYPTHLNAPNFLAQQRERDRRSTMSYY